MRGDRPCHLLPFPLVFRFTPHARGSTLMNEVMVYGTSVYPACAGIDPGIFTKTPTTYCLPRMRGDRPKSPLNPHHRPSFTPHARGSTHHYRYQPGDRNVYPACAGIDPPQKTIRRLYHGLPRMRGDRPFDH